MSNWEDEGIFEVIQLCKVDPIYQELLQNCKEAEAAYLTIRSTLSQSDQAQIERYIALCEETQHRMTQLAYTAAITKKRGRIPRPHLLYLITFR